MDVAVGATIAAVAKKVLAILLGDKKGRKFLLYVVGIALFIVCIPLITLIGMFGWMAGDGGTILNKDMVLSNLPQEQQQQIATMDATCDTIVSVFKTKELDTGDQRKASAIYISYLVGMESGDNFFGKAFSQMLLLKILGASASEKLSFKQIIMGENQSVSIKKQFHNCFFCCTFTDTGDILCKLHYSSSLRERIKLFFRAMYASYMGTVPSRKPL